MNPKEKLKQYVKEAQENPNFEHLWEASLLLWAWENDFVWKHHLMGDALQAREVIREHLSTYPTLTDVAEEMRQGYRDGRRLPDLYYECTNRPEVSATYQELRRAAEMEIMKAYQAPEGFTQEPNRPLCWFRGWEYQGRNILWVYLTYFQEGVRVDVNEEIWTTLLNPSASPEDVMRYVDAETEVMIQEHQERDQALRALFPEKF